ncbi:MAG: protein kinase [Acidobacteriota bacterium]|nr:protein kinase [Acidobacteriota bacterium]MDQ7086564.1 protein kinase [Acidobacteriota bacterium]
MLKTLRLPVDKELGARMAESVWTEKKQGIADGEDLIPGLRMVKVLAKGGFAEVWEAEQTSLGRKVAVKILREELLGQEQMVQLFEQEARVLARLNHANVVQVIDRGASPQGPYFVMEYIEGRTLQDMLSRSTVSRDRALSILLQATRGLAYAHRNGVVHRDVKPANILVSRTGQVKLSDFGIAAVKAAAGGEGEDETEGGRRTALGTRAFMAPEQRVSFDDVGPEADVYSLGVILHRILTGKLPPGPGRRAPGTMIPDRLVPIVEKALAASPGRRYPDAGAFREALVNALEGRHIDDRVRRGAASALGAAGRFELLDVIRQDERRSVYLVRKGGADGERIVVKRYLKDPEALRTVRSLIRIEHPNIIRILAVGEREDAFIMLMEHMPGGDLRERLVKPHPWKEAAAIGRDVALALACAHQAGIAHGNLRPSNILFDEQGRIRVTDFGLPEHYRGEPGKRNWYAAPEGGRSPAADVYALGAVLYEMLYATPVPESPDQLFADSRRRDEIPQAMRDLLCRLLAPAGRRDVSAALVAQQLEGMLEHSEPEGGDEPEPDAGQVESPVVEESPKAGVASHLPGVLGLAGLLLAWLLDRSFTQQWLAEIAFRFLR